MCKNKELCRRFSRFAVIAVSIVMFFNLITVVIASAETDDGLFRDISAVIEKEIFLSGTTTLNTESQFYKRYIDLWKINGNNFYGYGHPESWHKKTENDKSKFEYIIPFEMWNAPFLDDEGDYWLKISNGETVNRADMMYTWMLYVRPEMASYLTIVLNGSTGLENASLVGKMFSFGIYDEDIDALEDGSVTATTAVSRALVNLYDSAKVVGVTLVALYFIMGLISDIQMGRYSHENLIKRLLCVLVAILIMTTGLDILRGVLHAGDAFRQLIHTKAQDAGIMAETQTNAVLDYIYYCRNQDSGFSGFVSALFTFGMGLWYAPRSILGFVFKIVVYVLVIGRVLEMYVRISFSPIGIASLASPEYKRFGIRYFKRMGSIAIQGAIITIAALGRVFMDSFLQATLQLDANAFGSDMGYAFTFIASMMPLTATSASISSTPMLVVICDSVCILSIIGIAKSSRRVADDIMGI